MGLSQQKLADMMGIKRGKVAGYFYETQPRPDFYEEMGEKFSLNIGRFLTVEMSEENYESFFIFGSEPFSQVAESTEQYGRKSELIDLLMRVKDSEDRQETNRLLDEAIKLYGKVLDENNHLKDANSNLKDQLIELTRRFTEREK